MALQVGRTRHLVVIYAAALLRAMLYTGQRPTVRHGGWSNDVYYFAIKPLYIFYTNIVVRKRKRYAITPIYIEGH